MVLYTDGVTEAKNAQGEQFGIDRLCAELSSMRGRDVGEIRDALLSSVQRWSSRQDDDVTLMVLRRAGASS
jgi:serine phosphatase RsbU (regulator of sigma subunit)